MNQNRFYERIRATRNYFLVCRDYFRIMDIESAMVLSHLMNVSDMNKAWERNDGWFPHSVKRLEKALGVLRDAQQRILNKVVKKGFIEIRKKGIPAKRYVRIDYQAIEDALGAVHGKPRGLENGVSRGLYDAKPRSLLNTNGTEKIHKENPPSDEDRVTFVVNERSGQMGSGVFFQELEEDNSPITPFDLYCAKRLKEIIRVKRKVVRQVSITKWADEFRKLRKDLQGDTDRIEEALDFYDQHFDRPGYKLLIDSAKAFRDKFSWVEERFRKKEPIGEVEISEDARTAAKQCLNYQWPKGEDQVLTITQLTLDEVRKFIGQLRGLRDKARKLTPKGESGGKWDRIAKLVDRMLLLYFTPPIGFVSHWMMLVYERVNNWQGWSGNLAPWVFYPKHKMFQKLARGWTATYTRNPKAWDEVMEALDEG